MFVAGLWICLIVVHCPVQPIHSFAGVFDELRPGHTVQPSVDGEEDDERTLSVPNLRPAVPDVVREFVEHPLSDESAGAGREMGHRPPQVSGQRPWRIRPSPVSASPFDASRRRPAPLEPRAKARPRIRDDDHLLPAGRKARRLLHRRNELQPIAKPVARVGRPLRHPRSTLTRVAGDPQLTAVGRVQTPRLSLRRAVQPALPVALPIGLVAEELDPRERASVLDVFRSGADVAVDQLDELMIEREVELGLVSAEPYRRLIATRFRRGPGGSCTRICPRGRFWEIVVESAIPRLQGFLRGERRDSNPRPPGPQPGSSGASELF